MKEKSKSCSSIMLRSTPPHIIISCVCLLLLMLSCNGESTEIVVPLNNETVTLGQTAHFFCQARGNEMDIRLRIGGSRFTLNYSVPGNITITTKKNMTSSVYNISIAIINTTRSRNNTIVECYVINGRNDVPTAMLTILGGPAEPEVDYKIQREEEEEEGVLLSWPRPFSWEEYPITGYDVVCRERETEVEVENKRINETGEEEMIQHTVKLSSPDCLTIKCTVTAYNDLDSSPPSISNISIPMKSEVVRGRPVIDLLETIVQENGRPGIAVCVKLPILCEFQTVSYTIIISGEEGSVLEISRNFSYSSGDTSQCVTVGGEDLEEGIEYSVHVFIDAGSSGTFSSSPYDFKLLQVPRTAVSAVANELVTSGDGANTAEDNDQAKTGLIIDVAMGTVILIMIVILFILAFIIIGMWRASRRSGSVLKKARTGGATNQVFDEENSYSREGGQRSGEPYYHTLESSIEKEKTKKQPSSNEPLYTTPYINKT